MATATKPKVRQLLLIPLEEVQQGEPEENPNRRVLGAGPDGTFCRDCIHVKDRGRPCMAYDMRKGKRVQMHSHKWRCTASEGTRREKALRLNWKSCAYFQQKEKGQ